MYRLIIIIVVVFVVVVVVAVVLLQLLLLLLALSLFFRFFAGLEVPSQFRLSSVSSSFFSLLHSLCVCVWVHLGHGARPGGWWERCG